MYRVRAEKVSGNRVFAKGVWLTCIGNKPVSVGDLIYTDGRCVYGFYQESQQPLVITTSRPIDDGIPIITVNDRNKHLYYTYRKGILQETVPHDENGKEIRDNSTIMMINGYKDEVYFEDAPNGVVNNLKRPIIAANVDKQGNLYRMVNARQDGNVEIWKNDACIKTLSYEQGNNYHTIAWGFIENENDWAYILGVNLESDIVEDINLYLNGHWYDKKCTTNYVGNAYFCNSEGISVNIARWTGTLVSYGYPDPWDEYGQSMYPGYDAILYKNEETLSCDGVKFPMQDGYYFTMSNALPLPTHYGGAPWMATKNIYSPNGNLLFSGLFPVSSYLTINKNLIGVKDNNYLSDAIHMGYGIGYTDPDYKTPDSLINSGVYQIVNGTLQPVLASETSYYSFLNQRLRPMTKYKNWCENMVDMTIG